MHTHELQHFGNHVKGAFGDAQLDPAPHRTVQLGERTALTLSMLLQTLLVVFPERFTHKVTITLESQLVHDDIGLGCRRQHDGWSNGKETGV
jgi:hypothetical protein